MKLSFYLLLSIYICSKNEANTMTRTICTTISELNYLQAKKMGVKWNYLIAVGLRSIIGDTEASKLQEMQQQNESLLKKLAMLAGRVNELESKNKEKII